MIILIVILFIYLGGIPKAYLSYRAFIKQDRKWTIGERKVGLILSIFSWITVMSIHLVNSPDSPNSDKPAKW